MLLGAAGGISFHHPTRPARQIELAGKPKAAWLGRWGKRDWILDDFGAAFVLRFSRLLQVWDGLCRSKVLVYLYMYMYIYIC